MLTTIFNDLSDDIIISIFLRVPYSDMVKFMIVCKEWHRIMAENKLLVGRTTDILIRHEKLRTITRDRVLTRYYTTFIDYCNGLELRWNDGKYMVYNNTTKQLVNVNKPLRRSIAKIYAVLAYDPYQSEHFKIVGFERGKHLKVFLSEIWRWVFLSYKLDDTIRKATWVRQCSFFKGNIYRLSQSGHLLKFNFEIESSNKLIPSLFRASAISLPLDGYIDYEKTCIGICNGQFSFAITEGSLVTIWVLKHDNATRNDKSIWSLNHVIKSTPSPGKWPETESYLRGFAFYPYSDTVIIMTAKRRLWKWQCVTSSYNLSEHKFSELESNDSLGHTYHGNRFFFLVLRCGLRFASCRVSDSNDNSSSQGKENKEKYLRAHLTLWLD